MGCTTSRSGSDSSASSSASSTSSTVNFNTDASSNTTFPSQTYNPTNTSNRIKNIALEESTKSIIALAHFLGPNNTYVQNILRCYNNPTCDGGNTPLLYWPCQKCTHHNTIATEKCISCKEAKDSSAKISLQNDQNQQPPPPPPPNEKSSIMDEALSSIECSICLDTFTQPITLPCGHSLCASHHADIDSKCPFCRKPFSSTIQKGDLMDAALTQNVDVVLQLAHVVDSERDTVRDAIDNVNRGKCVIANGTVVSLQGLINATERNGKRGVVKMYNVDAGRYTVLLDGSHSTVSVRPTKLLQHARIRINGVVSKPELNHQYGTIVGWCAEKDRYNVQLASSSSQRQEEQKTISLKPKNVILESGTVVRFVNLVNKTEMNGTWGTIQQFVEGGRKYDVQLTTQRTIRINMENVRV